MSSSGGSPTRRGSLRSVFFSSFPLSRFFSSCLVSANHRVQRFGILHHAFEFAGRQCGKDLVTSAFRKHSGEMKRVFSELSPEELRGLEVALKRVGKRATALMEQS